MTHPTEKPGLREARDIAAAGVRAFGRYAAEQARDVPENEAWAIANYEQQAQEIEAGNWDNDVPMFVARAALTSTEGHAEPGRDAISQARADERAKVIEECARVADGRATDCYAAVQRFKQQPDMAASERCAAIEAQHIARSIRALQEKPDARR